MADQILPQGVRFFNKNAKAPDFVICTLVLTPDDLNAFCIDNESLMTEYNGKKQLRLQVLRSKEGNLYAAVDTWKPNVEAAPAGFKAPTLPSGDEDLPF
jgi:hypothetical protein